MRLRFLLIAIVSTTLAQQKNAQRSTRAPQAQIKYNDPNGLKVDWKFFAPQNQWRSHLQNYQRLQQEESARTQQSAPNHAQLQSHLVQIEPDHSQHRSYSQQQYQPQAQPDPNNLQTFVKPQPAGEQSDQNQLQYKVYPQPQAPVESQTDPNQVHYNAYSDAPSHVKQVVPDSSKQQRPYTDPSAFIYSTHNADTQQYDQQAPTSELSLYGHTPEESEQMEQQKTRREYSEGGLQGRIIYKEEYEKQLLQQQQQQQHQQQQQYQQQQQHQQQQQYQQHQQQQQYQQQQQHQQQQQGSQVEHVPVPIERQPSLTPQKLLLNKNMPSQIQELLDYQAQIPYDVIANSISYMPKTLFVPKPLSSDTKGPYHYRSEIYYVNNDEYQPDFEATKPVQEEQRH